MSDSQDRDRRPPRAASGRPTGGAPDRGGQRRADGEKANGPRAGGDRSGRPRSDGDKPYRPRADGDKPYRPRADGEKPYRPRTEGDKPYRPRSEGGQGRPNADRSARSGAPRSGGAGTGDRFAGARAGGERGGRDRDWEDRDPYGVKSVRNRHDDPPIPEDVQPKDLDRVARTQLKTLSKENAVEVARHLAMAARLIEEDPELAHRHAVSAARRAGRIAVVRETLAITAYITGDYALALRELRTYRRISGRDDQLPMMVDSERGMGRPERALELGRSVPRESLSIEVQVELAIAMSGARLDLGQLDQALGELESTHIDPDTAYAWSPALFDAYASVLEEMGRIDDAESWFARADRARHALHAAGGEGEDETIEVIEEDLPESPAGTHQTVGDEVVDDGVVENEADERRDHGSEVVDDDADEKENRG